jgi:hypothetical protein
MKEGVINVEERESLASKKAETKCPCYTPASARVTSVRILNNFFEVDGQVYAKRTNDNIIVW